MSVNLWTSTEHALDYLGRADSIPHRAEGESTLLEFIPPTAGRILDLGTGDGRLLALVKLDHPEATAVAIDFSPAMLEAARSGFAGDSLSRGLAPTISKTRFPSWAALTPWFPASPFIISSTNGSALYAEIYARLNPGGVFCNLEHVASPTPQLHEEFLHRIGCTPETEDPSNQLLDLETQLRWLREIGFRDVDCHWKWRELALLTGRRT